MIDFKRGVTLSPICRKDLPLLRSWRNDSAVWKWCRQNDLISEWSQEKWFEAQAQDPTIKMYVLSDLSEKPIGCCGFTSIDPLNQRAEFSLYIDPTLQRRGWGKKALETLFSHGFQNLNLHLIWGETFSGNPAVNLFIDLGMFYDGSRRDFYFRSGKFISAHLFSITAEEWRAIGICSSTSATSSA